MATNILNSPESNKNVELRQWAVNIIDKNSPIPFSQANKENLIQGGMTHRELQSCGFPLRRIQMVSKKLRGE